MTRSRVVVAGMGDSGLLTAIHLFRHVDVVGISAKPALVSGQELGMRLARPQDCRSATPGLGTGRASSIRSVVLSW